LHHFENALAPDENSALELTFPAHLSQELEGTQLCIPFQPKKETICRIMHIKIKYQTPHSPFFILY